MVGARKRGGNEQEMRRSEPDDKGRGSSCGPKVSTDPSSRRQRAVRPEAQTRSRCGVRTQRNRRNAVVPEPREGRESPSLRPGRKVIEGNFGDNGDNAIHRTSP
ncbi:hypothetical protein GCM10022287_19690 [Gryllotalpicola koreensis]|uniref:Uncharacterized protein n=1 Tax=Gryllotalpicola koreensis TaxID=993086 RepID=A0ABP8A0M9_9MICO